MKIQINITGNAYFEVKRPDTVIVYTLGRMFHLSNDGVIITAEAYELLEVDPLPVPFNETLTISETGEVSIMQGGLWTILGQIMAVKFQNPNALEVLGDGYYNKSQGSGDPQVGIPGSGLWTNVKVYYIPEAGRKERAIAVLDLPAAIGNFIIKARKILQMMTDDAGGYFINPTPTMLQLSSDIDTLEAAETIASTHVTGSAAIRDKAYNALLRDLQGLQLYVQVIADNADDEVTAKAIIESAGFEVKQHGVHIKDELEAKHGKISGQVILVAKAVKGAGAYEWQMRYESILQKNYIAEWTVLPATIDAKNIVNGLTVATNVHFRCRAIKKEGPTNWTQEVEIIVI